MRGAPFVLFSLLIVAGPAVNAETLAREGYEIHYTTFKSTLVPPVVARTLDIVRSESRIITNVAVRCDGQSVRARVDGTATNLLNQVLTLHFREIVEEDAIYYLANEVIDERDTVRFHLTVQPLDSEVEITWDFTREYYGSPRSTVR